MKSKLFLLFLMCLCSGVIYSQNEEQKGQKDQGQGKRGQRLTIEERVNAQTDKMKKDFELTDVQYDSVKRINLRYAKKSEETLKNRKGDFIKNIESLRKDQEAQNQELKAVLTEAQYKKYEEQLNARKERSVTRGRNQGQRPKKDK